MKFVNIFTLTFTLLLSHFVLLAQDKTGFETDTTKIWTKGGAVSLSFANVGLSNWAAGGQNTISAGLLLDLNAKRETKKSIWENALRFQFGMARVGDSDNLFKKTDDLLILTSKYGYKFNNPRWSVFASLDFRTQIADGYTFKIDSTGKEVEDQRISRFLAPGYLMLATGIQYKHKGLTVGLSPLTAKLTFVTDEELSNAGAFGVKPGENMRSELGWSLGATWEYSPMKNVDFKTTLGLFSNYETPDLIDVNWETLLVLKVNKYLNTSFGTSLIYDHDVLIGQSDGTAKRAIQFKHVLNVNVGFTF